MSDLIKRSEVWQALHNIGGCGADPDSWADGWDKAIDAAIEAVEKLPAACSDEIIRCRNCKYCFIDLSGREAHIFVCKTPLSGNVLNLMIFAVLQKRKEEM